LIFLLKNNLEQEELHGAAASGDYEPHEACIEEVLEAHNRSLY
jgi:hypothetical protein